ncbi:hypothetical protein LY13_002252 [Prauserella aidingensis]|uniref:hypothetical protein n=1 Tax=Prauserella aidingensis TaxID=387890 RepID=UPI0020A57C3E|nr:hypothetical protein [Prauserella aidingensis]MCP2253499.1 hypothetical protein [Prauserella aidingensis]
MASTALYPGGPGGEPPKKKTGLIVGIALGSAALLFGIFALLAWVTPGFLLSDENDGDSGGTGSGGGSGAQALAEKIVQGFNNQDAEALQQLTCSDADATVRGVIQAAGSVDNAELGDVQENGDTATAEATISAGGQDMPATASLSNDGGAWCWQSVQLAGMAPGDMTPSTDMAEPEASETGSYPTAGDDESGSSGSEAWRSNINTFVDAVNAGDKQAAGRVMCEGAEENGRISDLLNGSAQIQLGEVVADSDYYAYVEISGTLDGEEIGDGSRISMDNFEDNEPWCVDRAMVLGAY